MSTIHLDAAVYEVCHKHSITEYSIGWLIRSFVIKSCIIKDSFFENLGNFNFVLIGESAHLLKPLRLK